MKIKYNYIYASNDVEEIGHFQIMKDLTDNMYMITDLTDDSIIETNLTYNHAISLVNKLIESETTKHIHTKVDNDKENNNNENSVQDNNRRNYHRYMGVADIMLHGEIFYKNYTAETVAISPARARTNIQHQFRNALIDGRFPQDSYLGDIQLKQLD